VTHKGASADSGHYIGWVKRDAHDGPQEDQAAGGGGDAGEEWYKFDDDKVSIVNRDKISLLDGGGEDSTAYILLYR
jgi:ubiquitin carboxyl-terminal hydrolase 14